MMNHCYINSIAQVSCQQSSNDDWFTSPILYTEDYVRAIEPEVKGLLNPGEARRMSKILKRAVYTAFTALGKSGIDVPDAIITGTGMGCMENSEKFLTDLCKYGENCLKPTLFMQSTHNTISSLIAILMKCHGYNNTYSHKGISFESALFDAWLQIKNGQINNALVGSHDEVTPLMARVLRESHPEYAMISETSVSTVISNHCQKNIDIEISDIKLFYRPSIKDIAAYLSSEIDQILMLGTNGNSQNDAPYQALLDAIPFAPMTMQYKPIFGDNFSASAMSLSLAVMMLEQQCIPDVYISNNFGEAHGAINKITLINQSDETSWSIIRLKKI
jgi:hypothetical protein